MQTHGGEAAERAIKSNNRVFRDRILVDWNQNGLYDHPMAEISGFIERVTTDRHLKGSMPEEILLVEGSSAAQMTVEMSGEFEGMPLASLFSPYNKNSPFYGKPMVGAEIQYGILVETEEGVVVYPQFMGFVQDISADRAANSVTLVAADRVELLRRPVQLPFWAVSNEHLSYGEEDSQLVWSHWVIDHCLRLCNVSPAPQRPKFREEIMDYPAPNVGPQFYLSGNGSFLPTIGWMDNPNATSFPSAGTPMYHDNGPKHPDAPDDALPTMGLAGLGFPVSQIYGDPNSQGALRYWMADWYGLNVYSTHYLGFTINTNGPGKNIPFTTPLSEVMEVRLGAQWSLHIDVQAGLVRTRLYNHKTDKHYAGGGCQIPNDVDHVDVFAQWDLSVRSAPRSIIIAVRPDGSGYTTNWETHQSIPEQWDYDQIAGRVSVYQGINLSNVVFATRNYTGAGLELTEAYKPATYVAQLDRGINRLSFMPFAEKKEAWEIITGVAAAEFGSVFWDEEGVFHFWNWETMKAKRENPVGRLTVDDLEQLKFTNTMDSVRNVVTIQAKQRRAAGIVKVWESNDVNQFYTPPRSWKQFKIWVDDIESPLTFRPQKYDTEDRPETGVHNIFPSWKDDPIHGYCVQYLINGLWQESPVHAGVDISIWFDVDGFLTVEIWNGWDWPIRLASGLGEDSQPAFHIAGTKITDSPAQSIVLTNYESLRKYGARNLELSGEWRQDFYAQCDAVWDLMERTGDPIPATDQITVPADPRRQLGDCFWIEDRHGFGSDILVQILGINRTSDASEGWTDQLTVEVCNVPYRGDGPSRPPVVVEPPPPGPDPGTPEIPPDPGGGPRPYFPEADWHWDPIPPNPVLDVNSAAIANNLAQGQHVMNIIAYGNTLVGPAGIDASTPRYNITFEYAGSWGPAFPSGATMPIPNDIDNSDLATGGDKHLAVADPTTDAVYSLWIAQKSGNSWRAGWGGYAKLSGNGRESVGGSTGSGISRFACVIREDEIDAGVIPHALFFSTNIARKSEYRFPATKTDGSNMSGVANNGTIPEGARVQLDPTLDPDDYNLNKAERAIFVAMQKYGAYCGDNGGARMAFLCEKPQNISGIGSKYSNAGVTGDYYNLTKIPWNRLRVLKNWDGSP